MVILLYLLSSVAAVINHLKTLDESSPVRVANAAFCTEPDNLPLRRRGNMLSRYRTCALCGGALLFSTVNKQ
jgi:hypothetical protein